VVIDQDVVRAEFEPPTDPPVLIPNQDFWKDEHNPARPVPTRIDDLVIYELHVGALGFGHNRPGKLLDAMALLDHLSALGAGSRQSRDERYLTCGDTPSPGMRTGTGPP
jgi:1,4-alpha-glucan branching enzyme